MQINPQKVTIHDVAAKAGVSIKTVSRVVNKEGSIRPETRDRVTAAIHALNYIPNLSARGLAGSHSFLIGLLYDNPSANYIIDVQGGALAACRQEGFDLLIHPCTMASPRLCEEILRLVRLNRLGGLILTPPLSDWPPLLAALTQQGVPFARIAPSAHDQSSPCVFCNDQQAACELTRHLLSLGHRRIAFIKGHPDHSASEQRLLGYRKALAEVGLMADASLEVQGYFDFDSGRLAAQQLLAMPLPPTAIFASNDDMATGVIFAAHEQGLDIPAKLSVAGFDDTPLARQIWPTLTTVRQPIHDMAERAALLLIEQLRSSRQPWQQHPLQCLVQIRKSTGPVPR
ncbi:MAG: LacI family DNA-binding transcriptional regulator [Pseudomonadales bacterium]|nr:LacI family DNA-binding transcriptional regulator [Pseudomonadales bacterium]